MCIHRSISNTYELFHLTRLSLVCMGFEFVLERISTGFFFLFSSSLSFWKILSTYRAMTSVFTWLVWAAILN